MSSSYSGKIDTYSIYNKDYNSIPVKIRLADKGDPGTKELAPGQSLNFSVRYSGDDATFYFHHDGGDYKVQQIDLNDGDSSDDLNTPNQKYNSLNTLRYKRGDGMTDGGDLDVVNFSSSTYEPTFRDGDGIDKGPTASFKQTLSGSTMTLEISKP